MTSPDQPAGLPLPTLINELLAKSTSSRTTSYIFAIGYVARLLDLDEAIIEEIVLEMEPEDGCLGVH
jgi:hypothetical protein